MPRCQGARPEYTVFYEKWTVGAWATVLFGCCGESTTPRLDKTPGVRHSGEEDAGDSVEFNPKFAFRNASSFGTGNQIGKTRHINIQVFSSVSHGKATKKVVSKPMCLAWGLWVIA